MSRFRVVLDANVLFPIVQADLLLQLADRNTYVPLWSSEILDELVDSLIATGKTTEEKALRRVSYMNEAFLDAQVHNWELLVDSIHGIPDPKDRHVVAAAIEGNASAIVTNNLKDFPKESLSQHGLHAVSCDNFLLDLYELFPSRFRDAFAEMQQIRKNPPISMNDLLKSLAKSCPELIATYRTNQEHR